MGKATYSTSDILEAAPAAIKKYEDLAASNAEEIAKATTPMNKHRYKHMRDQYVQKKKEVELAVSALQKATGDDVVLTFDEADNIFNPI